MKLLTLLFLLTISFAMPEPSAILSPEKTATSKKAATKISSKKTTTTKTRTTTKIKASKTTTTSPTPTPSYACSYDSPKGLLEPQPGSTYYWDDENGVTFEILYCSAEYFKTSSKSGDVWFNNYSDIKSNGQIVALQQTPDNRDSDGAYSTYRFNVTVHPANGEAQIGPARVAFYEVINGYYVQYNYEIYTVSISIERKPSTPSSAPPTYPMATGIAR